MSTLKKNDIYTVSIEGYSSEAMGVCRIDGQAVFVPKTIIGEIWEIRIVKVSASTVYARPEKLISASPARRDSTCPYFGKCGGCDTWHMSYEEELRFKLSRVNDALTRIGKQSIHAEEIIACYSIERYRNKGIFAVAPLKALPSCGFYRERSHELIEVDYCLIQSELADRCAHAVIDFMRENKIKAYDEETHTGIVRHIFCRKAVYTSDAAVCIVAAKGFGSLTNSLVDTLREACPELTGIILNINKSHGNGVLSQDFYTLWGKADIEDSLCGVHFNISPQAFYQINPKQAEKLYNKAVEYADVENAELVFDLYCGAGTISLCLAKHAKRVIGAEIVPQAIENAKKNAINNGITNADFICADAGEAAMSFLKQGLRPDVVVVDPPRKGMDIKAIEAIASMQPERVVYVSCNVATLARDIVHFNELGYTLQKATAVDMFPRTKHVETVVFMSKKDTK